LPAHLLGRHDEVSSVELDASSGSYKAKTSKPEVIIPEIYAVAERLGLHVSSIYISETTLEDAFINLVTEDDKSDPTGVR